MEGKAKTQEKEAQAAQLDIWKYVFGFTPIAVLKCAIELHISETLEYHGGSITLPELSASLRCSPSALHRIMRYLTHHGFFKQTRIIRDQQESSLCYTQTPRSRLLLKDGMAALILLESSPVMLAPWHYLSRHARLLDGACPFESAHGGADVWEYSAANPDHSKLINDAMACHARLAVSAIVNKHPEVLEGVSSLVDIGGGDGTALHALVKACPWIRGINYDLPHVVSLAPHRQGVEHVAGDMFKMVPKADAAFLMWVLHDWSDEECVVILRNCMEAIPKDKGKVIIVEAVVKEGDDDEYSEVRLALDMVMMAHTEKGKERSSEEWQCLVKKAGFTKYTETRIQDVTSVIQVYP
ncbi:RS-norcoclaurine 6-O-methyltransferase [Dorcoceras hygrometricum]|uniref:RS-norcoclaurine 6-O-methyltransferase n=1 Tax=Dorcoceras hygrometricum TaxID=472368 RepID=A0A2Z7CVL3_9LAMI|nr:RS-norcoclaurine 6-O-methyltransferase [Dorcoceras hygrometricum]